MDYIELKAMAKVNLGLDVIGKRADGYHEVRMIMQTVRLYDRLKIMRSKKPGIRMTCDQGFLPTDERNLAYRAAKLLADEFGIKDGIEMELKKYIPVAAGMAGGSSDAAAALYGINRLFSLKLSLKELMERGVRLGADVPYCLMRGTALSEGIGEILTPLKDVPDCHVLIAKPPISVSTKHVYEALKAEEINEHPDIDAMLGAIEDGDLKRLASLMGNVLESVTCSEYPLIEKIKDLMKENGALNALMSGSGPSVFGLFDDKEAAGIAYEKLKETSLAKQVYLTDFYSRRSGQK